MRQTEEQEDLEYATFHHGTIGHVVGADTTGDSKVPTPTSERPGLLIASCSRRHSDRRAFVLWHAIGLLASEVGPHTVA